MKKPILGIKKKIATGFLLLLALVFFAVLSVIRYATQLTDAEPGVSLSVSKLTITSNLLSSIIEADGHARAYINTGNDEYLERYYEQDHVTRKLVDSLTMASVSNTNQFLRILIVDSLLDLKKITYKNYFDLRRSSKSIRKDDINKLVIDYEDSIKVADKVISKTITTPASSQPVEPKKKGFFPRLWSNIRGKNKSDTLAVHSPSEKVIYDTVLTYKAVRDTTLNHVRSQLKKIEAREKLARNLATEREMSLISADQDIMNEIRAVLLLFEKEEITKAIEETAQSRNLVDNLWITALFLAAAALLTAIVFIVMIWKDLARSSFYRRQLEKARLLAESLLKVKEQFLANMSHEIRTPLTSIIGFTDRLKDTNVSTEQEKYIKHINSSSQHLLELVNDLLDFSRIESGKLSLESKSFNPVELFENVFETLSARARDKGLEAILEQNIPNITLIGDPLRLRQIILNLLSNSVKFTEKGKVLLQTKVSLSEDGKIANLMIRVADTGIGIPDDKQNLIFEEFMQVDHGITRKYGGSGLGLAITAKLVDLMNGKITISSREGVGTIFTVKLSLPADEKEIVISENPKTTNIDLSGYKILVAEDDHTTSILITDLLQKYNARVVITTNGAEALALYTKTPNDYNIIVTDIQMPVMSGIEFIRAVQKLCFSLKISQPVIIGLTAHADLGEIESYRRSGIDHFILKPFRDEDILSVLCKIIKPKTVRDSKLDPIKDKEEDDQIDLSNFRQFAGDNEESLKKIVESLTANIDKTLNDMKLCLEKGDFKNLSLLAHRLLPNIRLLGAQKASSSLRNIELMCKSTEPDLSIITENFNVAHKQLVLVIKKLSVIAYSV